LPEAPAPSETIGTEEAIRAAEARAEAAAQIREEEPAAPRARTREPLPGPSQPAKPESIQAAIEKVTTVIGELRDVLNDMELVLEYLEDAERQQAADEREIETLQQRLNALTRRGERYQSHSRPAQRSGETTSESAS
jgi:hypothetical protein